MDKLARTAGSGIHLHDSFTACNTCPIYKSVKNDQPKTAISDDITQPCQVVCTDLIGPISPPAIGGYSYMSKFTDVRTRLTAVYFIAHKNEAPSSFVNFTQDVVIPLGLRVRRLHTDNGKEYANSDFRDYCKTTGVVQTFTAPHTPQQNGISERDGRTIMNMTRCLLHEARLPKHLWGEIAATSVFLINRLPKALKGDTPCYRMFGKQADLSFLRVNDARAFVHVEGHTTKLQPKAWEGVLVGYNNNSPSFRVYNRETTRITSYRNVTFIEEPQVVLPAADESGDSDFDIEAKPDSPDEDIIDKGISLLEQTDTTPMDTGSSDANCSSSSAAQDPRAGKITSRLRSSVNKDLPQPDSTNPKQAMASPYATQWEGFMHNELDNLNHHEVAGLIPLPSVPAGYSVTGTRWVYRVKTDGRFKVGFNSTASIASSLPSRLCVGLVASVCYWLSLRLTGGPLWRWMFKPGFSTELYRRMCTRSKRQVSRKLTAALASRTSGI